MTPAFVASVAQAIGNLEYMFKSGSEWAARLMVCTEDSWPFHKGDKLDIIVFRNDEQYKLRVKGEYGQFWNPDEESHTALLEILLPKINPETGQFLMPPPGQLFLNILGRAVDGLMEADKNMLRLIMPRLKDDISWEVDDVLRDVWKLVYDRLNG